MQSVGATKIVDPLLPLTHAHVARQNDNYEFSERKRPFGVTVFFVLPDFFSPIIERPVFFTGILRNDHYKVYGYRAGVVCVIAIQDQAACSALPSRSPEY